MKKFHLLALKVFLVIVFTLHASGEYDVPVKYMIHTEELYNNANKTISTQYLNSCSILISPQPDVFLPPRWSYNELFTRFETTAVPTFVSNGMAFNNWKISNYNSDTAIINKTANVQGFDLLRIETCIAYYEGLNVSENYYIWREEIENLNKFQIHINASWLSPQFLIKFCKNKNEITKNIFLISFSGQSITICYDQECKINNTSNYNTQNIILEIISDILKVFHINDEGVPEFLLKSKLRQGMGPPYKMVLRIETKSSDRELKGLQKNITSTLYKLDDILLNKVHTLTSPWIEVQNNSWLSILCYKPIKNRIEVTLQNNKTLEEILLETEQFIQNDDIYGKKFYVGSVDVKESDRLTLVKVKIVYPFNWNEKKRIKIGVHQIFVKYIWHSESKNLFKVYKEGNCTKTHAQISFPSAYYVPIAKINVCLNGGIAIGQSCVCPVGFAGEQCEIRCGENRYGKDCTRECTNHDRKCKGFIFCMPYLNCNCASGYKGDQCSETCDKGFYGADCKQTCGKCKGSCDPYTGHCKEGCTSPYFIAPSCKNSHSYFRQAPSIVETSFNSIKLHINMSESNIVNFEDIPTFFMVQFKMEQEKHWRNTSLKLLDPANMEIQIENLNSDEQIKFRVILFDELKKTHDPDKAIIIETKTICKLTESNLTLSVSSITNSSVELHWKESKHSCKASGYIIQIKHHDPVMESRYIKVGTIYNMTIEGLLPDRHFELRLNKMATNEMITDNATIHFRTDKTLQDGNYTINIIKYVKNKNEITLKWLPLNINSVITYYIKYKVELRWACYTNVSNTSLQIKETSLTTFTLLLEEPYSLYKIFVTTNKHQNISENYIHVSTDPSLPKLAPSAVKLIKVTKAEVHLKIIPSPLECEDLNGIFRSFKICLSSVTIFVREENFKSTDIILKDLLPKTLYNIQIDYVNHIGVAQNITPLIEHFKTKSAESLAVNELTAYKTSPNMIGLRWKMPNVKSTLTGVIIELKSFLENKTVNISQIDQLKCSAWPSSSCWNITDLKSSQTYDIRLKVLTDEYPEGDGEFQNVIAFTRETISSGVQNITFHNITENHVTVQWNIPSVLNGILRKFTLEVEHIAAFDENLCCESSNTMTLIVNEEKETYSQVIHSLQKASTYLITIKPFTRKPGAENSKTVYTAPPEISLKRPTISVFGTNLILLNASDSDQSEFSEQYNQLISDRLIIVQYNSTITTESPNEMVSVRNMFNSLLKTTNWWIAHVCFKNDTNCSVSLGNGTEMNSEYGQVINKALEREQTYACTVIQINTYETTQSYTLLTLESFKKEQNEDAES